MPSMISVAFIVLSVTLAAVVFVLLARRPAREDEDEPNAAPFECGAPPAAAYPRRVAVQYFLTAILFVVVLIALVLIAIWARDLLLTMKDGIALSPLLGAAVFVALVATGFVYAWRVGALNWEK